MSQEEYVGKGAIKNLQNVLKKYSPSSIFLVTGNNSYNSSGARQAIEPCLTNYNFVKFSDFSVNPKLEDIEKGMVLFEKKNCDLVIAIGGGSTIDVAKSINLLSAQQDEAKVYVLNPNNISNKGKPLVAIPTTAGSGSEATHFAVVYVDKKKYSLAHEYILPDVTIIDSDLSSKMSPYLTACSGMDALCQAIESYWSVKSNDVSSIYAKEAIRLAFNKLNEAVNKPSDDSRIAMARAANLAGKAINITKTTAPHAISYAFTTYFGIPHGHAVALTLPSVLVYNYGVTEEDLCDSRGVEYVKNKIGEIAQLLDSESVEDAERNLSVLMRKIGLETSISKLGVKHSDVDLFLKSINLERVKNNPRILRLQTLKSILENVY